MGFPTSSVVVLAPSFPVISPEVAAATLTAGLLGSSILDRFRGDDDEDEDLDDDFDGDFGGLDGDDDFGGLDDGMGDDWGDDPFGGMDDEDGGDDTGELEN
ncbi:MAG: hypothetical protein ABEJ80_05825, partial [Halarchaeum sp.]